MYRFASPSGDTEVTIPARVGRWRVKVRGTTLASGLRLPWRNADPVLEGISMAATVCSASSSPAYKTAAQELRDLLGTLDEKEAPW